LLLGHVCEGTKGDIIKAIDAARSSLPGWGNKSAYNISQILYYIAENLEGRKDVFVTRLTESGYELCCN
jgi:aldehyde dehydrogenase (NAD+)